MARPVPIFAKNRLKAFGWNCLGLGARLGNLRRPSRWPPDWVILPTLRLQNWVKRPRALPAAPSSNNFAGRPWHGDSAAISALMSIVYVVEFIGRAGPSQTRPAWIPADTNPHRAVHQRYSMHEVCQRGELGTSIPTYVGRGAYPLFDDASVFEGKRPRARSRCTSGWAGRPCHVRSGGPVPWLRYRIVRASIAAAQASAVTMAPPGRARTPPIIESGSAVKYASPAWKIMFAQNALAATS